jgi:hypothetical protein
VTSAVSEPLVFEPLELRDDPYPLYRRLRDEQPVYADPDGPR